MEHTHQEQKEFISIQNANKNYLYYEYIHKVNLHICIKNKSNLFIK